MGWWSLFCGAQYVPEGPVRIKCDKYISAGLAGISGHWLNCQRCKYEWKTTLEPDPYDGRRWYYCPRCTAQELGGRILAEYVERGAP